MSRYDGLGLDVEQVRRLQHMIGLQSTADIQKRLDQERDRHVAIPSWEYRKLQAALSAIEFEQRRLATAIERDAIQAGRPDGCWCLGVGGKDVDYARVGEQCWVYLREHCSCPEGQARRATDRETIRAYRKAERWERAELFREGLPARFQNFTLKSWKASTPEQLAVQEQLRAWLKDDLYEDAEGVQVDMPRSLVLHGPFGTGKTGLAGAIGAHLLANGVVDKVHIAAVPRLLDRVRATFNRRDRGDESEADVMEELFDVQCLILDDVGAERATDWATEKLFTLINHRHDEDLKTIITSNLDPIGLTEHLGERTMWRILEMSYVVSLEGCPNLRLRKPRQPSGPEPAAAPQREKVVPIKGRVA